MNISESNDDWWNGLSEDIKKGIQNGLNDIEEGRVVPHEKIRIKYGLLNQ